MVQIQSHCSWKLDLLDDHGTFFRYYDAVYLWQSTDHVEAPAFDASLHPEPVLLAERNFHHDMLQTDFADLGYYIDFEQQHSSDAVLHPIAICEHEGCNPYLNTVNYLEERERTSYRGCSMDAHVERIGRV